MKAEQNSITNSRWKERWTKGRARIKLRCEKTIPKQKAMIIKILNMSTPNIFLKETS